MNKDFDSLDKLVSTLESEGIKRNMPNTFMDFVTILQDSLKQGKDISEMIEASPYRSKIEEVLMSSIMKQAIQPKRKGMAAYQTAPVSAITHYAILLVFGVVYAVCRCAAHRRIPRRSSAKF